MNLAIKNMNSRKAFTLVELMVVTSVLGVLVTIVMLSYLDVIRSSRRSSCIANLRQIDTAVARYAVENSIQAGALPDEEGVYGYIKRGSPLCPTGGTYELRSFGSIPSVVCTKEESEEHKLL